MVKHRVKVDRTVCQGFGACVELCPSSFYLSEEDGKSKIRGGQRVLEGGMNIRDVIEVDDLGCFGQAQEACPFRAIKVETI
ncbi:MAG: ferredoxin [Candidatus Bathyarchaeota archaeon]|nr:ferredoxin [Candidatus Bathyarchaeota archaeon]